MPRSTPPSYDRKVVAIDFDGVIAPWGPLFEQRAPALGVVEAVHNLREAGFKVVILTSRLSPEWWAFEAKARHIDPITWGLRNRRYVEDYLHKHGIEYDEITAEKVQARVYFDDRAWRTTHDEIANDLTELLENGRMDADV